MTAFQSPDPVLACNMGAIPREAQAAHQANIQSIMASIQEVRELETGYALRLANEADLLPKLGAFLSYERLCCPFFSFKLELEPNQGPIWLSITGTIDVKEFIQSEGLMPAIS